MEHDTPSWGITPVPERLRVLGLFDLTLLWGNLSVSLLVIVAAAGLVPMLSLPQALLAIVIGACRRERAARPRRRDRRRRARAGDGAAARAARPARLVRADGAERGAEPRLVDLRADHHLDRGRGALGARLRLPRALALGAALRRDLARARADGADRLRPPLPEEVRRLGGRGLDRLPDLVGARQGEPARALAPAGHRRRLARPGDRPRDRQHHLLDAARGRLHALRARPAQRLLRRRGRLPACRRSGASGSARCSCSRAT